MEMKLVDTKAKERDMKMDELAAFWAARYNESDFGLTELRKREETSCCGGDGGVGRLRVHRS